MIFNCLHKFVTKEVLASILIEPEHYTFTIADESLKDGPCFLKCIINHTHMNTLANTAKARENLVSLKDYMESLTESNITEFIKYIKNQLETLVAGGETTNELITNLFKSYSHAKEKDFHIWICSKKQAHFDKTIAINRQWT